MRYLLLKVGTKRYDSTSGGEREIQRTMLELLNQVIFSKVHRRNLTV